MFGSISKSIIIGSIFFASQTALSATLALSLSLAFNSGGSGNWTLTAATDEYGLAGLQVLLKDVATVTLEAPRGTVNSGQAAGFNIFQTKTYPAYTEVVIGQSPLQGSQVVLPNRQNVFYGVGSTAFGTPQSSGVIYNNLSNVIGSPWATVPVQGPLNTAVVVLKGTFNAGQYPRFYSQGANSSTANIFTSVGTSTTIGTTALATMVTVWQGTPGDCDLDGDIDQDDYDNWKGNYGKPYGVCDNNRNGAVDAADYTIWRDRLGFNINNL